MKKLNSKSFSKSAVLGLVIGLSCAALIVNAAVSHVFTSGNPIVADEVNSNFSDLEARMTALEAKKPVPGKSGRMAYLWLQDPGSTVEIEAESAYSFNSAGQINTFIKVTTGEYIVKLHGMDPDREHGGNVQVTTYSTIANCRVLYWNTAQPDVAVQVRCVNSSGTAVDSMFTLLYIH